MPSCSTKRPTSSRTHGVFWATGETGLVRFWGPRKPDVLDIHDGVIVAGLAKMSALDNRDPATLLRLADRVSLTIIDEAHQAIAPTYAAILTALNSKRPHNALLGLTRYAGPKLVGYRRRPKTFELFRRSQGHAGDRRLR